MDDRLIAVLTFTSIILVTLATGAFAGYFTTDEGDTTADGTYFEVEWRQGDNSYNLGIYECYLNGNPGNDVYVGTLASDYTHGAVEPDYERNCNACGGDSACNEGLGGDEDYSCNPNTDQCDSCFACREGCGSRYSCDTSNGRCNSQCVCDSSKCSGTDWNSWGSCDAPSQECGSSSGTEERSGTSYSCSGNTCDGDSVSDTRSCTVDWGGCGSGETCENGSCVEYCINDPTIGFCCPGYHLCDEAYSKPRCTMSTC